MKTRYYVIFAAIGIVLLFPVISIVFYGAVPVGINYQYFENCEDCDVILDGLRATDSKSTQNPNECWYQEDDGSITPCKIDDGGSMMFGMFLVVFWPWIILGISIVIIFIIWRKRK